MKNSINSEFRAVKDAKYILQGILFFINCNAWAMHSAQYKNS